MLIHFWSFMSVDIVKSYSEILAKSIKSKNYTDLLTKLSENVDVKASVMGKKYEFVGQEKLQKFLTNMPAGISVDINKIIEDSETHFTIKVSMGMGFMKMPGKWSLQLNDEKKISALVIN